MYSEESYIDLITVFLTGVLQIRRVDRVLKDGKEISSTFHRHSLNPGDDLEGQESRVISIAKLIWTKDLIEAYKESQKNLPLVEGDNE